MAIVDDNQANFELDEAGKPISVLGPGDRRVGIPFSVGVFPRLNLARAVAKSFKSAQGANAKQEHIDALEESLAPLIASPAWQKIRELWVPLGVNLAGALVKIKKPAGGAASLTNSGLFVDGDYSPEVGLTGDGVGKYLSSSSNPTALGMVANDIGLAAHTSSNSYTGLLAAASTPAGNNFYTGYWNGFTDAYDRGLSTGLCRRVQGVSRMNFINAHAGRLKSGCGAFAQCDIPAAADFIPNNVVTIFSQNAGVYSNATITGYALFDGMTDDELNTLSRFFDHLNFLVGRNVFTDLVAIGDSITEGANVPVGSSWAAIVAAAFGLVERNKGASGSTMAPAAKLGATGPANNYERWSYVTSGVSNVTSTGSLYKALQASGALYTVALGLNDCSFSGDYVAFSAAYRSALNSFKSAGVPLYATALLSLTYASASGGSAGGGNNGYYSKKTALQYNEIIRSLADEYGCIYVDVYSLWGASNSATYLQGDGIHPNAAGHAAMSRAVIGALTAKLAGKIPANTTTASAIN